jgi:phosphatidate phosphatase APP1
MSLRRPPDLAAGEEVVFFPSFGRLDEGGATWALDVRGWVYDPTHDGRVRSRLLELLCHALEVREQEPEIPLLRERMQPFLVNGQRGRRVRVRVGGRAFTLRASGRDGYFGGTVRLPAAEAAALAAGGDWLSFEAVTAAGDARHFPGRARLVGATGLTVVSDIDDTVKVSEVHDHRALLANTFLREFRPVPGMADLYRRWAEAGAVFHYVSASPWQLYAPLSEFLRLHDFPAGTFHLKSFRPRGTGLRKILANPEKTKRRAAAAVLEAFPRRRFVLVGDSGERDPEMYAGLARDYPGRVARVLIRDVTGDGPRAERFREAFEGLPDGLWHVFQEPREIDALE